MLSITSTLNSLSSKLNKLTSNPDNRNLLTMASVAAVSSLAYMAWSCRRVSIEPSKCVVVITGCDSGFGLATAEILSAQGYAVIATCMTESGVAHLKPLVADVIYCDVTCEANVLALSSTVTSYLDSHEGSKLWTLVNNAGIIATGYVDWVSMDEFRKLMEVNYFAPIRLTKAFLPLLKRTCGSRIINLSSVAGLNTSALLGPYGGSKHALEGVGKALREELAPWNIHVCHINPGVMNTNMLTKNDVIARKCFDSAPKEITDQYHSEDGGIMDKLNQAIMFIKEDKYLVVNAIVNNITLQSPSFWSFPGYQATMLRYFVMLPRGLIQFCQEFILPFSPNPDVVRKLQQ